MAAEAQRQQNDHIDARAADREISQVVARAVPKRRNTTGRGDRSTTGLSCAPTDCASPRRSMAHPGAQENYSLSSWAAATAAGAPPASAAAGAAAFLPPLRAPRFAPPFLARLAAPFLAPPFLAPPFFAPPFFAAPFLAPPFLAPPFFAAPFFAPPR